MALSFSSFHGRLEQMEQTRNQRLSLLEAEKSLQASKYQVLESKLASIRSMEQRCLMLDQNILSQNFKISLLKSEIESLDAKYLADSLKLRGLESEVRDLEEMEREKDRFHELNVTEMKEFREKVDSFVVECRTRVNELRINVDELKSTFAELQGINRYFDNSEIAAAETRKSELLVTRENLDKQLASNYQLRAQLQRQLHTILAVQTEYIR